MICKVFFQKKIERKRVGIPRGARSLLFEKNIKYYNMLV